MASVVRSVLSAVSSATTSVAQATRRVPTIGHSDIGRVIIPGADMPVSQITQAAAQASLRRALAVPQDIHILHTGVLYKATDIMDVDVPFFADLTDAMFARANALTGFTGTGSQADALDLLFGANKIKGRMLSQDERIMRFGKGQLSAFAELRARNLDPAIVLARDEVLDALIDFCRGYVGRVNETGARFEFAWTAEAELLRVAGRLEFLYQLRIPTLRGNQLRSGTDALILDVLGRQAFGAQLKAYSLLDHLAAGEIAWRSVAGSVRGVTGPAIPKQLITDFLRYRVWGNKVPGAGMPLPDNPFPETSDWYALRALTAYIVDDIHMRNQVFDLQSEAFSRTGKKVLDIMTDINASLWSREQLTSMFPDGLVRGQFKSPLDMQDEFDTWLIGHLLDLDPLLNDYLKTDVIRDLLGRICTVRLFRATEGVDTVVRGMGLTP